MAENPNDTELEQMREARRAFDNMPVQREPNEPVFKGWQAKTLKRLADECPYMTRLAITAQVFEAIVAHGNEPGSFRHLIYDRLGFKGDAYQPLYEAGGMVITNNFELNGREKP